MNIYNKSVFTLKELYTAATRKAKKIFDLFIFLSLLSSIILLIINSIKGFNPKHFEFVLLIFFVIFLFLFIFLKLLLNPKALKIYKKEIIDGVTFEYQFTDSYLLITTNLEEDSKIEYDYSVISKVILKEDKLIFQMNNFLFYIAKLDGFNKTNDCYQLIDFLKSKRIKIKKTK